MSFSLKIQGYDERAAEFDGPYRYTLTRAWAPGQKRALVIGCNPSTADALKDDQTIRRLRQLLGDAGYDGFEIVNLFAFRATNPLDLEMADSRGGIDVVGPRNDEFIRAAIERASCVVAAWGSLSWAPFEERIEEVCILLDMAGVKSVRCFGETKTGAPRHPSRLPRSAKLEGYLP